MSDGTPRLRLRRPRLADAPDLFRFLGDAHAMRHTHGHASLRDTRRHIAVHERRRRRFGYAPWTIVDRADGRIVGWGGLYQDPFDPGWGVEIVYFFAPETWGKGYASELTRHCLDLARDRLGLAEVVAFAHPDNAGSRRVLEKTGFVAERFIAAMNRWLYRHPIARAA
ncbi:MAG: GNAT family N-acetyltransferase [Alphaproteobacteria bacterium]|nr:GNAT family N-acetyltransferase [Alphaproteobacteria bacterium]